MCHSSIIGTCFPCQVLCVTRTAQHCRLPTAACLQQCDRWRAQVCVRPACVVRTVLSLPQGRAACRKLESKLVADLQLDPGSGYRTAMLGRVKSNLGESKRINPKQALDVCVPLLVTVSQKPVCACRVVCEKGAAEECPTDVQHLCTKDKQQQTVEATVSEL